VWPPRGSGTPRLAAGARGPETSDVRELVVPRDAADAVRVHQFTRVSEAILLVSTYGEGSLASLGRRADEVTETTGTIVPAMCVFTKTGC
jgi:hypothetical protein